MRCTPPPAYSVLFFPSTAAAITYVHGRQDEKKEEDIYAILVSSYSSRVQACYIATATMGLYSIGVRIARVRYLTAAYSNFRRGAVCVVCREPYLGIHQMLCILVAFECRVCLTPPSSRLPRPVTIRGATHLLVYDLGIFQRRFVFSLVQKKTFVK